MVKDFKYIIKRIIIGVGIALTLGLIRGSLITSVMALQVDSYAIGQYSTVIDNNSTSYTHSISGRPWSSLSGTTGYINGNIGLYKVDGTSTSINILPLMVYINIGNSTFPCSISSPTLTNSTFNGGTYSYRCPVRMNSSGITSISVQFEPIQSNFPSSYRLSFGSLISYEVVEEGDVNVNIDTNGVISESQTQGNATRNTINNSTNSINNNQNQNTQNIINNQNQNTQQQIESQEVCKSFNIGINNITNNSFLNNNGELVSSSNWGSTDFYNINSNSSIKILRRYSANVYTCFYNKNKELISCTNMNGLEVDSTLVIPTNSNYVKFSVSSRNDNFLSFNSCTNGNQAIVDSQNNINNTLNDTSGGEVDSSWFDDFNNDSNSPVSDLLTMPITLMQAYLTGFSGNCRDMNLGSLYGTYIVIPCLNLESYLGSQLWSLIDVLFTLFMVYNLGMLCITIYEGITSLDDDLQYLYSPQHAGPGKTRVERNSDLY